MVEDEIRKMYLLAGERCPPRWDEIVKAWEYDLKKVPLEDLEDVFSVARQSNVRHKLLTPGHIIKAWEQLKENKRQTDFGAAPSDDTFVPDHDLPTEDERAFFSFLVEKVISGDARVEDALYELKREWNI